MPTYVVSGTAVHSTITGDVSPVDDAVAGEEGVTVETAARLPDGDVQFTLHVQAADEGTAMSTARRVADRVSSGSNVTLVARQD